ncbi:MAG: hypothetical protein IT373_09720 [Polyangiaceae bacterium]|nr:hypothetical protein [Polyangiaceae bacterium]
MRSKLVSSINVRGQLRWLVVLSAVVLPSLALAVASCRNDGNPGAPATGGTGAQAGNGSACVGVECFECAQHTKPGCPCETEGDHLACGKVEVVLDGQPVCGKGFSTCTNGVWAECVIDNAVTLVPDPPPEGFEAMGFGQPASCVNNPCDPTCIDFVDTPDGLADAGTGLKEGDGGITLAGDGGSTCVAKTCADQGKDCGPVSDTCGGLLQCGACLAPETCGGAGVPSQCGVPVNCTNLCLQQVTCQPNVSTTITGKVYAPNGVDPLPNIVVYVPNAPVAAFTPGVSCDNCANVSGSPLVSTTTDVNGNFTLTNMPVGPNIPLVMQIGRWRRQITIPNVAACTTATLAANLTRLPRTKLEGDIPKMAFVTGSVDALECVFRKIGVADSEFTNPTGTGRINFYAGGYYPGTYKGGYGAPNTPWESALLGSPATLDDYDIVLFPCQGIQYYYTGGWQAVYEQNLANYANAGGRIFSTHYSYIWLYSNGNNPYLSPLSGAINWNINSGFPPNQTGYIDTGFPKGALLSQWLGVVGASAIPGQIPVNTIRRDFSGVVAPTQRWMRVNNPSLNIPIHATFNTPLGAAPENQCGRVVFSDFHVENSSNTQYPFPTECSAGAMTPQEKLLEFMLFDLSSCVQPDLPVCTQTTCSAQGLNCGPAGDGCGGTLDCGTCPAPQTCGGGGTPGVCGTPFQYQDGYFVRDYDATGLCQDGKRPVWLLWSWSTSTPPDTKIDFTIQTATTAAGLAAAPADSLVFSNPPGPVALTGQAAVAHAAGVPAGSPDTMLGSASVNNTLMLNNRPTNNEFLRVTVHLAPSTDKQIAPTLQAWDLQLDCQDVQ